KFEPAVWHGRGRRIRGTTTACGALSRTLSLFKECAVMARLTSIASVLVAVVACFILLGCDGDRPAPLQTQAPLASIKTADKSEDLAPVSATDREQVIERLNSAIKAHGGDAALAKFQSMNSRGEGVLEMYGVDAQTEQELYFRFPDHFRFT